MNYSATLNKLFPLSFAQQRLWFLNELEPGSAAYNLLRVIRIRGTVDVTALTAAITELVSRHDALRTVFTSQDGEPRQSVLPSVEVELPTVDLGHIPEEERLPEALRIAREEGRRPFDLAAPLIRVTLLRLGREEHVLALVMHHIITDGWSMSIFFNELGVLYDAFAEGRAPVLPELTIRYSDFTQWQREHVSGELVTSQIDYWKKTLQGADQILELPVDRPRPLTQSDNGATEHFFLEHQLAEKLKALGESEGATPFMALLAAFQALLWRYTSQDTILLGTPVAGRNEVELEKLMGFFVNTLVLRADFSDNLTVRQLIKQARSTALGAYAHQDLPFERLVEELKPERILGRTPLFQAMLILQNAPKQQLELHGLTLEELEFDSGIAKFDLTLEVIEQEGFSCTFEYNSDLFDKATIKRMVSHFETLVKGFIETPDSAVSSLPILTGHEREQILVGWNNTAADFPKETCIHTSFELQVERTPDAAALLYDGQQLTYRQLNESANRLAHYLINQGVTPGTLVGISIERSLEMVIGLLGVLKAGAAYVPLDSSQPEERLVAMIEDSKVHTIVTLSSLRHRLPGQRAKLVCLDTDVVDQLNAANPSVPLSPDDRAYVIYTSGSTGKPKGVEGTHRASMNRFAWMWNTYPFGPDETCCQKTALSFIDSVWEIFGPLLRGVPSVIIPGDVLLDPEQFIRLLAKYRVSRIVLVPSLLRMLLEHSGDLASGLSKLKLWSASGEVLPSELAQRFLTALPHARLLNIYGSAEVAADVTWHEVKKGDATHSVPIGKPIHNTQIYILDRRLNPIPTGVYGEIYVGGTCLARGYWNNPENTAERFIRSPFAESASARLYKTGDLGRFLPDGSVEYLGRVDTQVKIRGMRVELGEIESVLRSHPSVREAAVVVQGEHQKLVAFVVGLDGQGQSVAQLRSFAQSKLPKHMVPASYVLSKSLPVLPSGKLDRKALPVAESLGLESRYAAPRNDIEEALANIWSEVLRVNRVGIEDNFFELGGHSLLAVQVISRIRRILDVDVTVRSLFDRPMIASLAETVAVAKAAGQRPRLPVLTRRAPADSRDMLVAQLEQLSPEEVRALLDQVMSKKSSPPAGEV